MDKVFSKLDNQVKGKAVLKIVISILAEILLIIVTKSVYEEGETVGAIVCLILWSIVCLVYFISGIRTLSDDNNLLKEYVKTSNISIEELENEFKTAKKIGSVYIGKKHVFSNDSLGVVVVPINSITKLEIVHLGANPVKRRKGYYYLYIYSNISDKKRKIYSVTDVNLKKVVEEISSLNTSIECIVK